MKNFFEALKDNPLFKGLGEDDIAAVLKSAGARKRAVKADEYILRAGDMVNEIGFLLSGSALVIQEDLWGNRNIISHIPEGDIFAEVFAAAGIPINVSVVACEDGEVLFLDVSRLFSMRNSGEKENVVVKNLVSALAKKMMALNEKITHISRRTTREKLLSYLSAQAVKNGSRSFTISFNRQQLADYFGVERAAMCVELSKLQREGILTYHKNSFTLSGFAEI